MTPDFKYWRRDFLRYFLAAFATPLIDPIIDPKIWKVADTQEPFIAALSPLNPTILENQKSGTTAWQLTHPATEQEIEGYASLTSVNCGQNIQLFVNTRDPHYTLEIFRMGWYQGLGGRRVTDPITRRGTQQPPPLENRDSGLIECDWQDPFLVTIPDDWISGVYLTKLTAIPTGKQSYIIFVVREDHRSSDILFQSSFNTFQAYNNWGHKSLYRWNSTRKQAYKVSFNRPFAKSPNPAAAYGVGAGEFLTNLQPPRRTSSAGWEYNMVRWLEKNGYDVAYVTDIDTHFNPRLLLSHQAFLVVGHDEYWSWEMRENVEKARDAGVSLGFLGGNICYWQIRLEPSRITGDLNRTIVAYKEMAARDPFGRDRITDNDHRVTTLWRDARVGKPEDAFIGVMYETFPVNGDMILDGNAPNWILEKTGFKPGDRLPGLLGYEVDRMFGNAPKNTVRVGHSPYLDGDKIRYSDMTLYQADSGAIVFATGSMQWVWGLDDYNVPQLRSSVLQEGVQQLTRNVLKRMIR